MSEQEATNESSKPLVPDVVTSSNAGSSLQDDERALPMKPLVVSEGEKQNVEEEEEMEDKKKLSKTGKEIESCDTIREKDPQDVGNLSSKSDDAGNGAEVDESKKVTESFLQVQEESVDASKESVLKCDYYEGVKSEEAVVDSEEVRSEEKDVSSEGVKSAEKECQDVLGGSEGVKPDSAADIAGGVKPLAVSEIAISSDSSEGNKSSDGTDGVKSSESVKSGKDVSEVVAKDSVLPAPTPAVKYFMPSDDNSEAANKQETPPQLAASQERISEPELRRHRSDSPGEMAKLECTEKADSPVLTCTETLPAACTGNGNEFPPQELASKSPPSGETATGVGDDQPIVLDNVSAADDDSSPSGNLEMDVSFASGDSVVDVPVYGALHSGDSEEPMVVDGLTEGELGKMKGLIDSELLGKELSDSTLGEDEQLRKVEASEMRLTESEDLEEKELIESKLGEDLTPEKGLIDDEMVDKELSGSEMAVEEKLIAKNPSLLHMEPESSIDPEGLSEIPIGKLVDEVVATTPTILQEENLVKGPFPVDTVDLSTKDLLPGDSNSSDTVMAEKASTNTKALICDLEASLSSKSELEQVATSQGVTSPLTETASSPNGQGTLPRRKEDSVDSSELSKRQEVDKKVASVGTKGEVAPSVHPPSRTRAEKVTAPVSHVITMGGQMIPSGVVVTAIPKMAQGSATAKSVPTHPVLISYISPTSTALEHGKIMSTNTTLSSSSSSLSTPLSSSSLPLVSYISSSSSSAMLSTTDSTPTSISSTHTSISSTSSLSSSSTPSPPISASLKSLERSREEAARVIKIGGGVLTSLAMPALTAVAPTVLTASTPVVATSTTSARQAATTAKKPVLSAGLSPTLSSNLAALFPSFAGKFALAPGSYAVPFSSSESSPTLVKIQQLPSSTRHLPAIIPAANIGSNSAKKVVIAPMISENKPSIVTVKPLPGSQNESSDGGEDGNLLTSSALVATSLTTGPSVVTNPVPVITHVSTLKGGATAASVMPKSVAPLAASAPVVLDQGHVASPSAPKLKVGQAKTLHAASQIQHIAMDKGELASTDKTPPVQALSVDFTQFVMPKVLGVHTVGPVTKFGGKKMGKTIDLEEAIPVLRMVNTAVVGLDMKPVQPGPKPTNHPVARRIWMSSCRPLDPVSL